MLPPMSLSAMACITGGILTLYLGVIAYALLAIGAPCLSALYALALARGWRSRRMRAWLESCLVPAGRMSLSNYLGQSLAANLLVAGWGLGLYASIRLAALFPLALAIAAAGLAVSALWLRLFRSGPAEWLLRAWAAWGSGGPRRRR